MPDVELGEEKVYEMPQGSNVVDVLQKLDIPKEKMKIALVNGVRVEKNYKLEENDLVVFFPPVGGG